MHAMHGEAEKNIYINDIDTYREMMIVNWKQNDEALKIFLSGEIDHFAAETLRRKIEEIIQKTDKTLLIFDFTEVTFMDSSGVGMLIGRYKSMTSRGGKVQSCGMSAGIERLYRMAGLHRIMPIMPEERRNDA